MFGKGKLLREGAQTQGVVIDARMFGMADSVKRRYDVTVRVQFDDGSTAEIKRKLDLSEVGHHEAGSILPIRYDPADRSRIEIDEPALKAQRTAAEARLKEVAIAEGERELRGEPTGVETTHRIGALMRELARAQQAGDEDEVRRIQDQIADTGRPGSQG